MTSTSKQVLGRALPLEAAEERPAEAEQQPRAAPLRGLRAQLMAARRARRAAAMAAE